jgi:hypothetical protein
VRALPVAVAVAAAAAVGRAAGLVRIFVLVGGSDWWLMEWCSNGAATTLAVRADICCGRPSDRGPAPRPLHRAPSSLRRHAVTGSSLRCAVSQRCPCPQRAATDRIPDKRGWCPQAWAARCGTRYREEKVGEEEQREKAGGSTQVAVSSLWCESIERGGEMLGSGRCDSATSIACE